MNWLGKATKKFSEMMYIPPEDEEPEPKKEPEAEDKKTEGEQKASPVNIPPSVTELFNRAKENSTVWGKSFASYAKIATQSATETANKLKGMVQEQTKQTFLGEFDREQSSFVKNLEDEDKKSSAGLMPWDDIPDSAIAKKQILALSLDSRNFLRAPPSDTNFDLEKYKKVASAMIESDPNLSKIRYALVPKQLTEEQFWTNYFYRCSLIRKSLAGESEAEKEDNRVEEVTEPETSGENVEKKTGESEDKVEEAKERSESPANDSDSSDRSEKIRVLKEKMDEWKSDEADWEEELANEIAEFEMVKESQIGKDENWEKEIEDMINQELKDGE
ncbi:hypothetical protein L596_008035 [Steinernema carpocapsae]|uniref:BSD domain-containing protein n=1 Tax=Steinernema carpocapsae TaxID=34508 RepID=A0A4U5PB81_STECR|nr:hypothetical protein L596_008035 [Steinernema carpocapsae]